MCDNCNGTKSINQIIGEQGPVGPQGPTGPTGPGAYQAWLDAGNVGDEAAFLLTLKGDPGNDGDDGNNGWSPDISNVADGDRIVQKITSWTGGTGTPPASNVFIGPTGLTANIAEATDIKGAQGPAGTVSWPIGMVMTVKMANPATHFDLATGVATSPEWAGWQIDPTSKGKVIVGFDNTDTDYNVADGTKTGGVKNVTLTANQSGLRGHGHTVTDPGHKHAYLDRRHDGTEKSDNADDRTLASEDNWTDMPRLTNSSTTGVSVNDATAQGALESHENRQPYVVYLQLVRVS